MEYLKNNLPMLRENFSGWADLSHAEVAAMVESIGNGDSPVQCSEEIVACMSLMTGFNIVLFDVTEAEGEAGVVPSYDTFYSMSRLGTYCILFSKYYLCSSAIPYCLLS